MNRRPARSPIDLPARGGGGVAVCAFLLSCVPALAAGTPHEDGLLFAFGAGLSPVLTTAKPASSQDPGSDRPDVRFSGMGLALDLRAGWIAMESPLLGKSAHLRDQLFVTFGAATRITPMPGWSFSGGDSAGASGFMRPYLMLDMAVGPGATWLLHPHGVSVTAMAGAGIVGLKSRTSSVRTRIGPAFSVGAAKEWQAGEHWRSGVALRYGRIVADNPSRQGVDGEWNPRETYASHLLSVQWTNSITPPRVRRTALPPQHP